MNRYHLLHATEFLYDGPVYESYNEVRLRPIHDDRQSCLSFRLTTLPNSRVSSYKDGYGNWIHVSNILPHHRRLRFEAESVVLVHEAPAPEPGGMQLRDLDAKRADLYEEHFDWVAPSAYVPYLPELAEISKSAEDSCDGTVAGFVQATSDTIHRNFVYMKGATHVHSSVRDSLTLRAGVCQDFAHLLLGVVRMRGLPARYVSGYLVSGSAGPGAKQEEVIGGQASHAWAEVFLPGQGWVGFDPTLGNPIELRHIRVAYGRDYGDVPPVRGVYKGRAGQSLSVDVRFRPALDDSGHEQFAETSAEPEESEGHPQERPQQHSQQQ
ncbi:MAG: transglutaminase family protein [Candidatus Acidiferrum sp.]